MMQSNSPNQLNIEELFMQANRAATSPDFNVVLFI